MNKTYHTMKGSAAVLVFLSFVACQSHQKSGKSSIEEQKTWSGSMQDLQKVLSDLLPMAVTKEQFNAPQNKKQIEADVKALVQLSKSVKHNPVASEKDPSVKYMSEAFAEDVQRIDDSLRSGKVEFARYSITNVTSYCIECHTRTSTGPSFNSPQLQEVLKNANGLQRGEYLLATRQFDAALEEFAKEINRGLNGNEDFFNVDKAVKYSLSITVKYQKDPQLSMRVVDQILKSKSAPYYLVQNAQGWQLAIHQWMKEKSGSDTSISGRLRKVDGLIRKGQAMQEQTVGRGGDIYFLRALSELHLILAQKPTGKYLGQALYQTGVSYELVKDLEMSELSENYFEICIRKAPGSLWAQKSYRHLEESVYLGFTGSSGTSIPADVRQKLADLKKIAFPAK